MITVKFSPGTKAYKKHGSRIEMTWQDGTIDDLLAKLAVDKREVGSVLVNNSPKNLDEKLQDNCEVYILPVICGG
ncbi:MAG: hypothetical protein JG764_81 [Clostridiales bacterium]|jgi:molybdopterin converting factor small subunit|nr:hypothetical protein [Clostridiales bacterium]